MNSDALNCFRLLFEFVAQVEALGALRRLIADNLVHAIFLSRISDGHNQALVPVGSCKICVKAGIFTSQKVHLKQLSRPGDE